MKNLNVTPEEHQILVDAAADICNTLGNLASHMAHVTNRTMSSCVASMIRPYFTTYYTPELEKAVADKRTKPWDVHLYHWDVSEGQDRATLLYEERPTRVNGFDGIAKFVQRSVGNLFLDEDFTHEDIPEFGDAVMAKKLGGLRPTLYKAKGTAVLRCFYALDERQYLAQVEVSRVMEEPKD